MAQTPEFLLTPGGPLLIGLLRSDWGITAFSLTLFYYLLASQYFKSRYQ